MNRVYLLLLLAGGVLLAACGGGDSKESQTLVFDELPALSEGKQYTLSATSTSGLPVTFRSSDPSYAKVEGNTLTALKNGIVYIIASQEGNDAYYEAPEIRRLLTVNAYSADKKDQEITFLLDVGEWKISQGALSLTGYATSSSGLPVTFSSSRESAATISADGELNVVFGIDKQTITIYASQAGNDEYNPAATVSRKLDVVCDQH